MSSFFLKRSRSCLSLLSQNTRTKTTTLSSTQLHNFVDSNQIHSRSPSGFSSLFIEVTKNPSGSNQNIAKVCSFESRNLEDTTLASGYCILRQDILKSPSGFRLFATQAAIEPSTSDGLTVEAIVANQWIILDESESDWKSHAAAIAQSIKVIKKRLQWKKLMVRLNLLSAELNKPNLWDDPVHAGKISREHGSLTGKMKEVKTFEQELLEHIDMIKLAQEEGDTELESVGSYFLF
ncbi:hypothetical protein Pint_19615 [Pistacia integerrima]|uniref:Uncharacterized protein n=1 Tax=Pistacia integerrima TaxID=434235 RepID=A0ACC0XB17_9ROSI|nr:hypothetical protein Pint_19615 [Pistacia integerrima]